MNIILTDLANITVYLIPVVPAGTKISALGANSTQNTLSGKIRVLDNPSLRTIAWTSFFPVNKNYNFVSSKTFPNGWVYVDFIETMRKLKLPIRIIGTSAKKILMFNFLATIDEFSYGVDKTGDINYSILLTEFPEGFFDFVNREKQVFKYIENYITNSGQLSVLKKAGLM